MKSKHCEWCDHSFEPKVKYQIYCSAECRELATREKIAEKYKNERIKKRVGKNRTCKVCGTLLSIYNDDVLCQMCDILPEEVNRAIKDLRRLSNGKE